MRQTRWILTATGSLVVLLILAVFVAVRFAEFARTQQGWVVHTYQVIAQLQTVLQDIQEAESSQRGYIITREQSFRLRYYECSAKTRTDLAAFRRMTADNRQEQLRSDRLDGLVSARAAALEAVLQDAARHPAPTPTMIALMTAGKTMMAKLQDELRDGIASEKSLLAQRIAASRMAERQRIIATILMAMFALAALVGTGIMLLRSERKLERQSEILQATLDNVRDGIAMFSSAGKLCAFNRAFFALQDYPQSLATVGTDLAEFAAASAQTPVLLRSLMEPSGERTVSYRFATPTGREIDAYRTAMPDGGFVIVATEVTARVHAENIARQAQKMEAIGQLTGGLAHDFNNLLQVVNANLDLISGDSERGTKLSERVQNAVSAVNRGAKLTSQLLAFARRQTLDPRSTHLGRLIQDMTDLLRRTLGEQIEVECTIAGGLWNTLVDPTQVENAILNLAINARDAMPDGGKLTLEVANAFLDDAYSAQHTEVSPGQYVMVAVSDTGNGIPPEVMERVFEPFFTTKSEGHGTGLGLSQVYGFVKQSGGHIKMYSEVGQGTTVKLYLPRTRLPQEDHDRLAFTPVRGGEERILIVEDDESVRAAAFDTLTTLGYAVYKASNAEEALTILNSGAAIDLLFTDVVMPGPIKTRDLARRAQDLHPEISVLYTSGYTQNAIVHNGRLDDGVFLISKPYRREELAQKIRSLLDAKVKPATAEPAAPEPDAPKPDGTAPVDRVLVVEDEALIRMATVDMIGEMGIETYEAADAVKALDILRATPGITVVITDMGLPGMSGAELIDAALVINPSLRILIATGRPIADAGLRWGAAVRILSKPFTLEALRSALAR